MGINELNNIKVNKLMADEIVNSKSSSYLMLSCGVQSGHGSCGK